MSDDKPEELSSDEEINNEISPASDQSKEIEKAPSFFDLLYGVLVKPSETLRYIADSKPVFLAILFYVAVVLVNTIASLPGTISQANSLPNIDGLSPLGLEILIAISVIVVVPILYLIFFTFVGGILHLAAKLLKGNGQYSGLISALSFSSFPGIFAAPLLLINQVGGLFGKIISGILWLALFVWMIVLDVIAVRENYKFSTLRAVAVYIIPLAILFGLALLIVIGIAVLISVVIGSRTGAFILGMVSP